MVSQSVEYALRAMSHLALLGSIATTSQVIADATHVPRGYLSKIMRNLVRANLVKSYRGRNGGFVLARNPSTISVLDILNAVDPIRRNDSHPSDKPQHIANTPLDQCLDDALTYMLNHFATTSLESLLRVSDRNTAPTDNPGYPPTLIT